MALTDIKKLLKEGEKYIKNPDVIIDVFDMTYVWVSKYHCKITEYTEKEQINMQIAVNSQLVNGDTRTMALEVGIPYQPFERMMIITTKTGKKKMSNVQGIVINFNGQPYIIGKMNKPTDA